MQKIRYLFVLTLCMLLGSSAPAWAQLGNRSVVGPLTGGDSLRLKLASIFQNIDKSQVPTGYLAEAGVRMLDLSLYNGVLSESNRTDLDVLNYLRAGLGSARVYGQDTLPTLDTYHERVRMAAKYAGSIIPITVQHMTYATIRPDALDNNLLTVQNEQVYDVPGRTQNPYQSNILFAAAPIRSFAPTNQVSFLFKRNLYLSGTGVVPSSIALDFGTGNGYQTVTWNQPLTNTYPTAGIKRVKVRFTYTIGGITPFGKDLDKGKATAAPITSTKTYESWFDIEVLSVAVASRTTGTRNCSICDVEQWWGPTVAYAGGTAYTIYGNGPNGVKHTQLTKPFIISEGYNLYDIAPALQKCNNPNNTIEKFFESMNSFSNQFNFKQQLLNAGYDIVYIDNAAGTDDITRNASLFEVVVDWINANKVGQMVTGEQNVVMGQSMGGLVARYGLAKMTRRGYSPHTRLLILHDSPQRGANNPVGLQSLSRSTDVPMLSLPFIGSIRVSDLKSSLSDAVKVLDQPATRQLSILSANNGRGDIVANNFIDGAYKQMVENVPGAGYEIVALSNGSQCGIPQNTPPHVNLISTTSELFLRPLPYIGNFTLNADMNAYGLPAYGQSGLISSARVSISYSLCIGFGWLRICIPIRYYLLNERAQAPANTLPYETLPGGTTNLKTEAEGCPTGFDYGSFPGLYSAYLRTSFYDGNICFVPSYSSLDVEMVTPTTAFARYINNATNNPSRPRLRAYLATRATEGTNVKHLTFTAHNSEWVFNEMQRPYNGNTNPLACDPNPECDPFSALVVAGPKEGCPNSTLTYTIPGLPANAQVSWEVTPAGILTPVGSTTGVTLTLQSTSAAGWVQVQPFVVTAAGCRMPITPVGVNVGPTYLGVGIYGGCGGLPATFTAAGLNLGTDYRWTFGTAPDYQTPVYQPQYDGMKSITITLPGDRSISSVPISVSVSSTCPGAGVQQYAENFGIYHADGCANERIVKVKQSLPVTATLYPNPARATVDVHVENTDVTKPITVRLFDARGHACAEQTSSEATVRLSTDKLPAGLYFVHILRGRTVLSRQQLQVEK